MWMQIADLNRPLSLRTPCRQIVCLDPIDPCCGCSLVVVFAWSWRCVMVDEDAGDVSEQQQQQEQQVV